MQAHILVRFLAYVRWKALGRMCHLAGLGDEPRKMFEELKKIALVDVVLPTRNGITLRKLMCFPALRTPINTLTKTPAEAPIHDGNRSSVVETWHDPC